RGVRVGGRLWGRRRGGRREGRAAEGRLRLVEPPAGESRRAQPALQAHAAADSDLTLLVAGPDAARHLAAAAGRAVLVVDAAAPVDLDLWRDAAVHAVLRGALLAFEGLDALDPVERRRTMRTLRSLPRRLVL